jgi:hypothetical protein
MSWASEKIANEIVGMAPQSTPVVIRHEETTPTAAVSGEEIPSSLTLRQENGLRAEVGRIAHENERLRSVVDNLKRRQSEIRAEFMEYRQSAEQKDLDRIREIVHLQMKLTASEKGAHYTVTHIEPRTIESLRGYFPTGECNDLNFVLFSTSGVHGMYTTIEEIEESLTKYGSDPEFLEEDLEDEVPDDWHGTNLTVLIVQPRLCGLRYGTIDITLEDIPYLKQLRQSGWDVVQKIGAA